MRVARCLFAIVWLQASSAFAQAELDWQSTSDCPSAEAGHAQVEQLLRTTLANVASTLAATVRLQHRGRMFTASIAIAENGAARTRELHDEDCAVVAHAAAVIVALAIDPSARDLEASAGPEVGVPSTGPTTPQPTARSETTDAQPQAPLSAAEVTRPRAAADSGKEPVLAKPAADSGNDSARANPAADSSKPTTSAARPFLGAGAALALGVLPKGGPVLSVSGGLDLPALRIAARLAYAPSQRAGLSAPAQVSGDVGLYCAALEAGPRAHIGWLDLFGLVGLEAGVFDARASEGATDGQTMHPLWLGTHLGVGAMVDATAAVAFGLRLEGVLALRRPRFVLQSDLGQDYAVHRPSLVSGRGWIELEVRFF